MHITRRRFLLASSAGGAALAAGGISVVRGTQLEAVRSTRPRRPDAPPLRIALVSDVHAPHNRLDVAELQRLVGEFDPHLLMVCGDSINRRGDEHHLALYDRLSARAAKLAVFGNHEHWGRCRPAELSRAYERSGVRLLVNERLTVDHEGEPIEVVGLDDWRAGAPNLELVREPAGDGRATTLVMAHCPVVFDVVRASRGGATYVFSGHTHGGQVAPFGVALATPHGSGDYVKGWYRSADGTRQLYVSRGIGYVGVPFRVGSRPELSLITL